MDDVGLRLKFRFQGSFFLGLTLGLACGKRCQFCVKCTVYYNCLMRRLKWGPFG